MFCGLVPFLFKMNPEAHICQGGLKGAQGKAGVLGTGVGEGISWYTCVQPGAAFRRVLCYKAKQLRPRNGIYCCGARFVAAPPTQSKEKQQTQPQGPRGGLGWTLVVGLRV